MVLDTVITIVNYDRHMFIVQATDPSQQFSAPFKSGNSRQVQICYISQEYNTKEATTLNWFIPAQEKQEFS